MSLPVTQLLVVYYCSRPFYLAAFPGYHFVSAYATAGDFKKYFSGG